MTNTDRSTWAWQYDTLGQVKSAKKSWSDSAPVAGQQLEYAFDDIGNRTSTKVGGDTAGANQRSASYSPNSLNQYTSRTVPPFVEVQGAATNSATLTVNGQSPSRRGEYFRAELAVDNAAGPVWWSVTNLGLLLQGTNVLAAVTTGHLLVPPATQTFTHDLDGNQTSDGVWTNTWDAASRLVTTETLSTVPVAARRREVWSHLPDGRWSQRIVSTNNGSGWFAAFTNRYVWDGTVLLAVLDHTNGVVMTFLRGLDLSGSMQGAGGVGGVLAVSFATNGTHFDAYDGNGNVAGLVAASNATVTATYEYAAFGEVLRATGPAAGLNPMQFSTQYADEVRGTVKYLFRDYTARDGRWLSRDPIEERGGVNVFAFSQNDGVNRFDALGQQARWYTKGFNADAYGLIPWSLSVSFTVGIVQAAVGGAIEVVYDCSDGTAEAFGVGWVGAGFSTPNPLFLGASVGKGLNFIYNLPSAIDYKGVFIAVTGTATGGAMGGYGTMFTTPLGIVNLAQTGSVGSETWGFGAGWTAGLPGLSALLQFEYFLPLGPVPFSAQQRASICRCKGTPLGNVPSQQIRIMARVAGDSKKAIYKQKLKASLPWFLSTPGAGQQIDQASWEENVW